MADSDKTLELLIKLGVIGKEDAQAANDLIKETSADMGVLTVTQSQANEITKAGGEEMGKFSIKGREFHEIVSHLNRIVPGLGTAMKGVSAASEGMLLSIGPLLIAVLSLDVATESWKGHQEEAKQKADALTASLDKQRQAFRDANEEQKKYNEELAKAGRPQNEIIDQMERAITVYEAGRKAKRKLLGDAGAGKSELSVFDNETDAQKLRLENKGWADLQDDMWHKQDQRDKLSDQYQYINPKDTKAIDDLTAQIRALDDQIIKDKDALGPLSRKTDTESQLGSITTASRQAENILNLHDQTGQSFQQLLKASGKSNAQVANIVQELIAEHLNFYTVVSQLRAQIAAMRNHTTG